MNQSKSPVMVGPAGGPVSGQMIAFIEACKAFDNPVVVDAYFSSWSKVVWYWIALIRAFLVSAGPVYITTSRSFAGYWVRDFPVFVMAKFFRRKIINHLHGNDFRPFRDGCGPFTAFSIDVCYSWIAVSCVPARTLAWHYERYSFPVEVVPNFYEDGLGLLKCPKNYSGECEVLYFSNFIPSKGFSVVYSACKQLVSEGHKLRLTMCGGVLDLEDSQENINKQLDVMRRDSWVTISEPVFGSKKLEAFERAHVLILPTKYPTEASPICLIEALAAGCYVISTDQGAISELVGDAHGAITTPDSEAVAEALKVFICLEGKAEVERANRQYAFERYSSSSYRRKITGVISGT